MFVVLTCSNQTGGSDTTSLKSSIMKYRKENGRTYHAYKDGSMLFFFFLVRSEISVCNRQPLIVIYSLPPPQR